MFLLSCHVGSYFADGVLNLVGYLARLEGGEHGVLVGGTEDAEEVVLELGHLVDGHAAEQSLGATVEDGYLLFNGHRVVLCLDEQDIVLTAAVESHGGDRVHIGREFGEGFQLTILRLVNLQCAGNFLHTLNLSTAAHTADGDTYVDGGALALVEEIGVKVYLTIGDGDDVGGDVCCHVASLCLDDGQRGE